jgi:hypothetical protein
MATWTYSNWVTLTTASARLTGLRQHIQEVSDALANPQSVNSSSHGLAKFDLQQYLESLMARETAMAWAWRRSAGRDEE